MQKHKSILFIVPYPLDKAPSQRFRVEQFFPLLTENSIYFRVESFFDQSVGSVLYKKGAFVSKFIGVVKGFFSRIFLVLFRLDQYDYVFIHREASPIGPPFFEWYISRIKRKKIIFDFDDAIWIPALESPFINWLKASWKIKHICRWSYKITAGNQYLANYARQYNSNVVVMPTCVDTEYIHNRIKYQHTEKIVVGWTGSHSTLAYLKNISVILQRLADLQNVEILVICNKPPEFSFDNLSFIPWNKDTEVDDLLKMNIGIMPLQNDKWSEGKCGFKLIQYLALGIPAVASPVGVNNKIIDHGMNGFLCTSDDEWLDGLTQLINDVTLRVKMGQKGREKIVEHYSVLANAGIFLSLFD